MDNNREIKIELHLLHNFPPSCLNRDDANMPKDCYFGGRLRARISSQCLKRTVREEFRRVDPRLVGARTKRLKNELRKMLSIGTDDNLKNGCIDVYLREFYSGMDKDGERTTVLTFVSKEEIEEGAKCIQENMVEFTKVVEADQAKKAAAATAKSAADKDTGSKEKKTSLPTHIAKSIGARLKSTRVSADIALFGRMLAENRDLNEDAACQVAHAISTHEVSSETDFFTAVDDLNSDDTGAGMMGIQGFNSACFYRYSAIDRAQLVSNLKGDTDLADRAIEAFLKASVSAIPTAKKNSTAPNTPPSLGMIVVRDGGTTFSMANAFATPVSSRVDLIAESKRKFVGYCEKANKVYDAFEDTSICLFHDGDGLELGDLQTHDKGSVRKAIDAAMSSVKDLSKPK